METWMIIMRAAWLITALGAILVGAMELGMDFSRSFRNYTRPINLIIGLAGVISLIGFIMMMMNSNQ